MSGKLYLIIFRIGAFLSLVATTLFFSKNSAIGGDSHSFILAAIIASLFSTICLFYSSKHLSLLYKLLAVVLVLLVCISYYRPF